MYAARALRVGYPLDAMHPGFELELGESSASSNLRNDFLVAAHCAFAGRDYLDLPVLFRSIPLIHAEQIACEERCLVATGTGTNFDDDVALVHGIFRHERKLYIVLQGSPLLLELRFLGGHHGTHLGIGLRVRDERIEIFDLADNGAVALHSCDDGGELGKLA